MQRPVGDVLQQVGQHEGIAGGRELRGDGARAVEARDCRVCVSVRAAPQPQRHRVAAGRLKGAHMVACTHARPGSTPRQP